MATPAPPLAAATPQPVTAPPAELPKPAAPPPVKTKSRLALVKRGLLREAKRWHFYGPGGVGKTMLAADAPNPIFFDLDTGSGHLDLARYSFRDGEDGHVPRKIEEVYAGIDDLITSPHDFKTLVIDTMGAVERLVHAKALPEIKVDRDGTLPRTLAEVGFGKGPAAVMPEWRVLFERLDQLRLRRGVHIVCISHAVVRNYKNPTTENYGRFEADVDGLVAAALYQWCETVGFVTFDDTTRNAGRKTVGAWSGYRVVKLEHNAAWDAKTRLPLPPMMDLPEERPFSPFVAALEQLYVGAARMREQLEAELGRLGETFVKPNGKESTATAVRAAIAGAGDNVGELTKYLNQLKQARVPESAPVQEQAS